MHYLKEKHLFILAGQSNMARLPPEESFIPAVEKKFGKENIIVVKHAMPGVNIYRWYKNWKSANGETKKETGVLYNRLLTEVKMASRTETISTITFIWLQGENDAKSAYYADVYEPSLLGLYAQLQQDLDRQDINWVIARISDFDMDNHVYKCWTQIREIQVKVANSNPRFTWLDTDDLNDGIHEPERKEKNDLHYSKEGYQILGKRFADAAIVLIERKH